MAQYASLAYHLVATTDKDRNSPCVGALLDDQHLLACRTECHLPNHAGSSQLLGLEVLESWDDAAVGCNSNQLDLGTSNPPNGGKLVLKQQVVGLIVETPLADNKVRTSILELLDHLDELFPLVVLHLLEFLDAGDVEFVLGLRLRWLKGACENRHLCIPDLRRHLRVGEVFVDDDTLNKEGVLERASNLAIDLDKLEVDIPPLKIGHGHDCINSNLGELIMCLGHNLRAKTRPGNLQKLGGVVLGELNLVGDAVELCNSDVTGLVVSVGNSDGVDALVDQISGLLEHGAGENDDACGTITDLVVLRLGELDEQLGHVVADLHLLENGGTIVGDCDISIGGNEDLVEATGAERALDEVRDGSCGEDVRLDGFVTELALLLSLTTQLLEV